MSDASPSRGAIVLCGGKSQRMGRDKAGLPFGEHTLLARSIEILSEVVPLENILCVAADQQPLPPLPDAVLTLRDPRPDRGPLAALAWGLKHAQGRFEVAAAIGCDAPLLMPEVLRLLFDLQQQDACVIPVVAGQRSPLPGIYPASLAGLALQTLKSGHSSLRAFLNRVSVIEVDEAVLSAVDPHLQSLRSCNTPGEYEESLRILGRRPR